MRNGLNLLAGATLMGSGLAFLVLFVIIALGYTVNEPNAFVLAIELLMGPAIALLGLNRMIHYWKEG